MDVQNKGRTSNPSGRTQNGRDAVTSGGMRVPGAKKSRIFGSGGEAAGSAPPRASKRHSSVDHTGPESVPMAANT